MRENMKKIILLIIIALSVLSLALFVGCKGGDDSVTDSVSGGGTTTESRENPEESESGKKPSSNEEKISLSVATKNMIFGDRLDIICFYGGTYAVEWSSSDEAVAVVDNDGAVSTVGVGDCVITAKAGNSSASCKISVSMGNYLPELKVLHLSGDELTMRVGDEYEPEIKVLFNKVYYDCEIGFSASDNSVAEYANGKITAKAEGEVIATVTGKWLDFSSDRLNKEIKITVRKDAEYDNAIVIDGEEVPTSIAEISVTPEWQGKTYPSEAEISSSVTLDGKAYACEFSTDDDVLLNLEKLADGKVRITANGIGNAVLTAKYTHTDGKVYETKIPVEVYCPTEVYSEQLDFCPSEAVDVATIFGTQYAKILSASQGGKDLKTEFNYIEGVTVAGDDTESMTILTTVGGFVFEDVFAYDMELDKDNIAEVLQLGKGNLKKDGYYILNSDITETIDFTSQSKSVYNASNPQNDTYFCGTFDGRGHTLKAKVAEQGIFGGFYDGTTVKNTKFIIEFSDKTESCGLAGSEGTFNLSAGSVVLSNLNVETVNYFKNSYALLGYCNFNLEMYDIFVNIKGNENNPDYSAVGIESEMAALFHYDLTSTMASNDSKFKGGFRNIFVVTGKFMPMACSYWRYGKYRYVSYAKNDESYLGEFKATGYSHIYTYCHVTAADDNPNKDKYFGTISYSKGANEGKKYAWIFRAKEDITDGGIERYDTEADLARKIDKIGSWVVG